MHLYKIQVGVIYTSAILVAVKSDCLVKRLICKILTGTLADSADPDQSEQGLHYVLKLSKGLNETVLTLKMPRKPASENVVC